MKHIVQMSIGAVAIAVIGTNYLVHRKPAGPQPAPAAVAAPSGPMLVPPSAVRKPAPVAAEPRQQAMAPAHSPALAPQPASPGAMETNGGVQRPADPPAVMYRPPPHPPRAPQQ